MKKLFYLVLAVCAALIIFFAVQKKCPFGACGSTYGESLLNAVPEDSVLVFHFAIGRDLQEEFYSAPGYQDLIASLRANVKMLELVSKAAKTYSELSKGASDVFFSADNPAAIFDYYAKPIFGEWVFYARGEMRKTEGKSDFYEEAVFFARVIDRGFLAELGESLSKMEGAEKEDAGYNFKDKGFVRLGADFVVAARNREQIEAFIANRESGLKTSILDSAKFKKLKGDSKIPVMSFYGDMSYLAAKAPEMANAGIGMVDAFGLFISEGDMKSGTGRFAYSFIEDSKLCRFLNVASVLKGEFVKSSFKDSTLALSLAIPSSDKEFKEFARENIGKHDDEILSLIEDNVKRIDLTVSELPPLPQMQMGKYPEAVIVIHCADAGKILENGQFAPMLNSPLFMKNTVAGADCRISMFGFAVAKIGNEKIVLTSCKDLEKVIALANGKGESLEDSDKAKLVKSLDGKSFMEAYISYKNLIGIYKDVLLMMNATNTGDNADTDIAGISDFFDMLDIMFVKYDIAFKARAENGMIISDFKAETDYDFKKAAEYVKTLK